MAEIVEVGKTVPGKFGIEWLLEKELGSGMCGVVYYARNKNDPENQVALKIIDLNLLKEKYKGFNVTKKELRDNFMREIEITNHLRHRNIIWMEDYFSFGTKIVLCMEFIDGQDLLSLIPKGGLKKMVREMFFQICTAVAILRTQRVIHGDLKPENILVRKADWRIKLIDFGFAQIVDEKEELRVLGGTVMYCPPCDTEISYAWDDWAVGIILFAMLCGSLPFTEQQLVSNGDLEMSVPSHVSDEILPIFEGLLNPNRFERESVGEIVMTSAWLEGERQKAVPESVSHIYSQPHLHRKSQSRGSKLGKVVSIRHIREDEEGHSVPLGRNERKIFDRIWRSKRLRNPKKGKETKDGKDGEKGKEGGKDPKEQKEKENKEKKEKKEAKKVAKKNTESGSSSGFTSPFKVGRTHRSPPCSPLSQARSLDLQEEERERERFSPPFEQHPKKQDKRVSDWEMEIPSSSKSPLFGERERGRERERGKSFGGMGGGGIQQQQHEVKLETWVTVFKMCEVKYCESLSEFGKMRSCFLPPDAAVIVPDVVDRLYCIHKSILEYLATAGGSPSTVLMLVENLISSEMQDAYFEFAKGYSEANQRIFSASTSVFIQVRIIELLGTPSFQLTKYTGLLLRLVELLPEEKVSISHHIDNLQKLRACFNAEMVKREREKFSPISVN